MKGSMKICVECFDDVELRGFIVSQNQTGRCDACNSSDVFIIDINEILDFAKSLLNNFQVDEHSTTTPLVKFIQQYWDFFRSEETGNKIISEILKVVDSPIKDINTSVMFNDDIKYNVGFWETLKEQLKWKNRYITNINYLTEDELGWDSFFDSEVVIQPAELFYRGRLQDKADSKPFSKDKMFSPTKEIASAGRANPHGIPFLYLCDNKETVPYEIRASYLDEVSIGTFRLKDGLSKKIRISDFTEKPSLFLGAETSYDIINRRIKSTLLKKTISYDLSKPMRRYDSELDYIPTQFICEFLKTFTGVDGIKFKSSLHTEGNNYVIFDQSIMECTEVERYKINKVEIEAEEHNISRFIKT